LIAAMPNSRTIPGHLWEHAQRALVFYFAHHGAVNAEDLAQDTLAEVWRRSDYEFRKDADFLRVCYAFARLILKADWRRERQRADAEMAHCREGAPARSGLGLNQLELAAYLQQVMATGQSELSARDWDAIEGSLTDGPPGAAPGNPDQANRGRVQLHRARKKLSRLIGWKR
jgi:DNA-directed RNA polymerase specialized sigma24 family protein